MLIGLTDPKKAGFGWRWQVKSHTLQLRPIFLGPPAGSGKTTLIYTLIYGYVDNVSYVHFIFHGRVD